MERTIEQELLAHINNLINDGVLTDENVDDWHHHAFNEDYYIIGYYKAEQWLKKHDISPFEAIADVIEWEKNVFGETQLKAEDINAEKIVNLYVYIKGEEVFSEADASDIEGLKEYILDNIN